MSDVEGQHSHETKKTLLSSGVALISALGMVLGVVLILAWGGLALNLTFALGVVLFLASVLGLVFASRKGVVSDSAFRNALFAAGVLTAIILTVYFRIPMLHYFGFYEPDGYYHYSVIRAAVNAGFSIPHILGISGWPQHAPVTEPFGLYWMTLLPYFFLRFFGVTYYTIMRLIPVAFGVFDVIGAYFLSRYVSKDKLFGILVMAFMALNMGNAARTSALIYRGDSFVTAFLIIALIFTIEISKTASARRKITYTLISGFSLSVCNAVWNGASFATATYVLAFVLILLFGFVFERKKLIDDSRYMLGTLILWFLLVFAYVYTGFIQPGQTFTGVFFLYLFIPMVAGWYAASYLSDIRHKHIMPRNLLHNHYGRFALAVAFAAIVVLVIYLLLPEFVYQIFVANGFEMTSGFAATIQELQPPTPQFIISSFGLQSYTSPTSIIVLASTYYQNLKDLFWVALLALFIPYLFMQIYDSGGLNAGNARVKFDFGVPILVLISFFALTAYLQMHAIRFNSLISVPLSIFGAYTLYWVATFFKTERPERIGAILLAFALFAFIVYLMLATQFYLVTSFLSSILIAGALCALIVLFGGGKTEHIIAPLNSIAFFALSLYSAVTVWFSSIISILLSIFGAGMIYWLVSLHKGSNPKRILALVGLAILIVVMMYQAHTYLPSLFPADNIDPQFISALAWFKNNSASNSVVLTLWPDGSLVEGVANRTSVTDSVGSQNATKAGPFAEWLFNSSPNPGFLTSSFNGRPDYLLVRTTWMLETGGIFTESGINTSSSTYGYSPFSSINERMNATTQVFLFQGNGLTAQAVLQKTASGQSLAGYLIFPNNAISPFSYIDFYNEDNATFSQVAQTAFNRTNNDTLLILYSSVANPSLPINITNAYLMTNGIMNSNMVKFLFMCGGSYCPWNNNVASLRTVYVNPDTKIFKIIYSSS